MMPNYTRKHKFSLETNSIPKSLLFGIPGAQKRTDIRMVGICRKQPWRTSETISGAGAAVAALLVGVAVALLGRATPAASELKNSLTVTPPFDKHDHKGSRIIPFWETGGATNIMQSFIRVRIDRGGYSRGDLAREVVSLLYKISGGSFCFR